MAFRITQGILVQRALYNLQNQNRRLFDLQTQLATGQRVNKPSDDPIDARRAINTRATMAKYQQYLENITNARPRLEESATAIRTALENLQRARELTLQGANGTSDQNALNALAEEINQLLESYLTTANHQSGNLYIFAGTRTQTPPFEATRDVNGNITAVTYQGDSERIPVAIGDGAQVFSNEPGSGVFLSAQSAFQTLIDIRDNMLAGDRASLQNQRLTELETIRIQLGQAQARIGATQNRLTDAEAELEDFDIQLRQLLSDTIDADLADVVINLNAQSNAFQAALQAAADVIQPSLLDFLR